MGRLILVSQTLTGSARRGIDISGDRIRCLSATGAFRIETDAGDILDMAAGLEIQPANPFRSFAILDLSGSSNTITLAVGLDVRVADSRSTISGTLLVASPSGDGAASTKVSVRPSLGSTIAQDVIAVGATATLLRTRTVADIRWTMRNVGSVEVQFGSSAIVFNGATTTRGLPLYPGEAFEGLGYASVYGIVASGTCNVIVMKSTLP